MVEEVWTDAEMTRALKRIETMLLDYGKDFVGRGEWEGRNRLVDSLLTTAGREISEVKAGLRSKQVPATSIIAIIMASITPVLLLLDRLSM